MTDTELTDMLRSSANKVVNYAADRIEQLTAERDRLGRELNVAKYGQPDFAWSVHLAAMAEVQAERDRLREALGKLECKCSSNCDWERDDVCPSWISRAALKGESHE